MSINGVPPEALMEAYQALRNDDRVNRLQPGTDARKTVIAEHLDAVSSAYGIKREDLAMALAASLEKT